MAVGGGTVFAAPTQLTSYGWAERSTSTLCVEPRVEALIADLEADLAEFVTPNGFVFPLLLRRSRSHVLARTSISAV